MGGRARPEKRTARKPSIAIVGTGSLATFLTLALHGAGFPISEIVAHDSARSRRRARSLAAQVGAAAATGDSATLDAGLLWLCVPDRAIRGAASALAERLAARKKNNCVFAFHSSGALLSRELEPLSNVHAAVASVHPLMTFVGGELPALTGVPFALEGDASAVRLAGRVVRALGGESFRLPAARKAAYHAWATLTSPLLLAFLVTLEEAARAAGLTRKEARRKSLPIIQQTLANYSRLGPSRSFSGPLIRGDAATVAKHLQVLKRSGPREVYVALAQAALRGLPVKNREEIRQLLRD